MLTVTPGVDRQAVQNAIEAYTYFFEHLSFASVVGAISDFGYADGALNITANIAASPLYISLTPSRITLRTQVDAANLTVTAAPGSAYAAAGGRAIWASKGIEKPPAALCCQYRPAVSPLSAHFVEGRPDA